MGVLVVEFGVDSPILREALSNGSGTTVAHEAMYQLPESISFLFWADGDELDGFDEGLRADPTVTDETVLAETQGRRLYRVTFTEAGEAAATFPAWSDLDISFMHSRATTNGWEVRMRFPGRDALQAYRDVCEERDLAFELHAVYEQWLSESRGTRALTQAQREALTTARELGYFEIPRRATLADVASELGITPQSLSERLRRAIPTLVDAVLEGEQTQP